MANGIPRLWPALRDPRIVASRETIARALVGDYRTEHLFTLQQSLRAYRQHQQWIAACDVEIERQLRVLPNNLADDQKAVFLRRVPKSVAPYPRPVDLQESPPRVVYAQRPEGL